MKKFLFFSLSMLFLCSISFAGQIGLGAQGGQGGMPSMPKNLNMMNVEDALNNIKLPNQQVKKYTGIVEGKVHVLRYKDRNYLKVEILKPLGKVMSTYIIKGKYKEEIAKYKDKKIKVKANITEKSPWYHEIEVIEILSD